MDENDQREEGYPRAYRAAEVFEAHGDKARVGALIDEARREPELPYPR